MLAKLIKEYQKRTGYSMTKISKMCGVSRVTFIRWASGENKPSKISIKKLCRGLGWGVEVEEQLLDWLSNEPAVTKKKYERNVLNKEFWELLYELEDENDKSIREVREDDPRLIRIRELVGGKVKTGVESLYDKSKVEELRIKFDMSGKDLGNAVGYSESWYNATFRRKAKFTNTHARIFSNFFGVPMGYFIKDDEG